MSYQIKNDTKSLQVSLKVLDLIKDLSTPKTHKEVSELLSNYFGFSETQSLEAVDYLIKLNMLLSGDFNLRNQTTLYSNTYSNPDAQKGMLLDLVRTESYKRAIEEVGCRGNVVDVGCGSGILSMFAASAGADKVYAIEVTDAIKLAQKLANANNFGDKIDFLNDYAQNIELDVKADLIISEWMGYFAMEEYMFDAVQIIRDRYLANNGIMIPSAINLYFAPIENRELYYNRGPGFWNSDFFGYNFNVGVKKENPTDRSKRCVVPPESLIASSALLLHFDCLKDNCSAFHFSRDVEWVASRDAFLHGFCGYFDAVLTERIILSTSPMSPTTHWQQIYYPIEEISIKKSDVIRINMITSSGSRCPTVYIKGSVIRAGDIVATFNSKPFIDGTDRLGF
jgi:protein arginine N-methyltransferase 1